MFEVCFFFLFQRMVISGHQPPGLPAPQPSAVGERSGETQAVGGWEKRPQRLDKMDI